MKRSSSSLVLAALLLLAPRAEAQDAWHRAFRYSCPGALDVSATGVVACRGTFTGTRFDAGPSQAVGRDEYARPFAPGAWLVEPDWEYDDGGLATLSTSGAALTWTRGAHDHGGMIESVAVSPDRARVATIETGSHGALWLVERSVPALARLRHTPLRRDGRENEPAYDVAYGATGLVLAGARGVYVVTARGTPRLVVPARGSVYALTPSAATAAVAEPGDHGRILVRFVDVATGREKERVELDGAPPDQLSVSDDLRVVALRHDRELRVWDRDHGPPVVLDAACGTDDLPCDIAVDGHAVLARAYDATGQSSLLSRWEPGAAAHAAPTSAPAPAVDLAAFRDFQTPPAAEDAPRTPLGRIAAGQRVLAPTRLVHADGGGDDSAYLDVDLVPASQVAPDDDATRWTRNVAAMLGTMYLRETHVVSATRGARVVELEGFGDGCDPPPAWVRVEEHGAWLVRIELGSYDTNDGGRARAAALRELLRHAVSH